MEPTELDNPDVEHERRDVPVRAIVQFLLWLSISTVVISLAMWGLFRFFEARLEKDDATISPLVATSLKRTPPGPRLERDSLTLKLQLRARENERLGSYSWADQPAGVARIPIERAMDLVAERGVPGGNAARFATPTPGAGATPLPTSGPAADGSSR
jgi:hypothetical protein